MTTRQVTYLLEMEDDTLKKITVPRDWTITFGALIPGSNSNSGRLGLRLWKGKQQKAVFQGVKAFRDMSMHIEDRVTTVRKETYVKQGEDAGEAVIVDHAVHEWVNPDNPRVAQKPAAPAPGSLLKATLDKGRG